MSENTPTKPDAMYLSGGLGMLFSRVVGLLAGIVSLWILTRLLNTADFAAYMLAMSLVYICGFLGGFGLHRVLLLKISPLPTKSGVLQGAELAQKVAVRIFLSSTAVAIALTAVLYVFPGLTAQNNIAIWFALLSPIVPAVAMTAWLIAWLQSNHLVGRPQSLYGQIDGLRCLGLGAVFFMGLGTFAVACAAVIATIIPSTVLAWSTIKTTSPKPSSFEWFDILDGLKFFGLQVAQLGMRHADILVLGFYAPPDVVAPYVIASRLAFTLEAGQLLFVPAYMPRARQHALQNAHEQANREYHVSRQLGLLASAFAAFCLILVGDDLLQFFEASGNAYATLLLLSAGHVLFVGAGLHSVHLSMSGNLKLTMLLQLCGFAVFLSLLFTFVPSHGALGAAGAFLATNVLLSLSGIWALWRTSKIKVLDPLTALTLVGLSLPIVAIGINPEYRSIGSIVMILVLTAVAVSERNLLIAIFKEIRRQVFSKRA